ncbi:MAG TPA: ketopantoate reductase family protein [Anaeromyxobacter sp.]|nr:ketopantoate reductase family protein [Anaeromyxobacter sp.]
MSTPDRPGSLAPPPPAISRVVLCGAGAVGGSYAERFHALDPKLLTVIAAGERRRRLESEGLSVNDRRLPLRCLSPDEPAPPADLLLVAVKHHHLVAAIEDCRRMVGPGTVIVSLLNGISSEADLGRAFGPEKVLPAFVIGNDVLREGNRIRYANIGRLVFGAPSNDPTDPRVVAVKALLDRAGIPSLVPANILHEQWFKFMLNVGVNQVSAVLRVSFGAFGYPEVRELIRRAAAEVVAVSGPEGVLLSSGDPERIFPIVARLDPGGKSSMLQDVEAGRKTEVEMFAGTVAELGRRHAIPTPVNDLLGLQIAVLERQARVRP